MDKYDEVHQSEIDKFGALTQSGNEVPYRITDNTFPVTPENEDGKLLMTTVLLEDFYRAFGFAMAADMRRESGIPLLVENGLLIPCAEEKTESYVVFTHSDNRELIDMLRPGKR